MALAFIKLTSTKLFKSADNLEKNVDETRKTSSNIGKTLEKQSLFKRQSIAKRENIYQKRKDIIRRREQKDIFEASGASGALRRTGKVITNSSKGFLGRILEAVSIAVVGWAVLNFPVIIALAEDLGKKIQKVTITLSSFMTSIYDTMQGILTSVRSIITDLTGYDFVSFDRQIGSILSKLSNSFTRMEDDLFKGLRMFANFDLNKELNDVLESLNIPKILPEGEKEPQPPAYQPPAGAETTAGGKVLTAQAGYSYLRQLGVSHIHALGILANIKGESGFRIDSKQSDGPGVGLFQYSSTDRKQAFLQNVPDWKTNWKGQIKYAIGEGVGPAYFKTQFSSAEEAADWWMLRWERPSAAVYGERRKKHNDFIKSFKPGGVEKPGQQPGPVSLGKGNLTSGTDLTKVIGQGVSNIVITDEYLDPQRPSHRGLDIAAPSGTYIALRVDCQVVGTKNDRGGYGIVIDVWVPQYKVQLRFGHCSSILINSGTIPAGTSFARVGSTGRSTGPHIHFEYTKKYNKTTYGSDGDPSPYVPLILLTTKPNKTSFAVPSKPRPADVTAQTPKLTITNGLRPEQTERTLIVTAPPQIYQNRVISGGGVETPFIVGQQSLNSLIKQRILIELAYT